MYASGQKKRVFYFLPANRPPPATSDRNDRRRALRAEKKALAEAKTRVSASPSPANIVSLVLACRTKHGKRAEPALAALSAPMEELASLRRMRDNGVRLAGVMSKPAGQNNASHTSTVVGALIRGCGDAVLKDFAAGSSLSLGYLTTARSRMASDQALSRSALACVVYAKGKRLGMSRSKSASWDAGLVGFFQHNSSIHSGQNSSTLMLSMPRWVLHSRLYAATPELLRQFASREPAFVIAARKRLVAKKSVLSWLQANVLAAHSQAAAAHFDKEVEYDLRFQQATDK
jgi:hypothetical protein